MSALAVARLGSKENPHSSLPPKKKRITGQWYLYNGEVRYWDEKILKCKHKRQRCRCKDCGGGSICEHNRIRSECKDCDGGSRCEHNRIRSICKDCDGGSICEHKRVRTQCKDCGGGSRCEHNRIRSICKDCGGGSRCVHDRIRNTCKDCGGSSICIHNRIRSTCKDCGGGSRCTHNRIRSICKDCGGGGRCKHNRERKNCKDCNPKGHLASCLRGRLWGALKAHGASKNERTLEYVNCSVAHVYKYIESLFTDGMSWDNYGLGDDKWHLDHRRPCASFGLNDEEQIYMCFHWTNLQPMWQPENLSKGDDFDPKTFRYKWMGEETGWVGINK